MILLAAAIQRVQITNWPATLKPDETTAIHLNQLTGIGIFVSAVVGLFIILTFRAQSQEFKLQRTIRLVDDFFNERLDGKTTPSQALREGLRNREPNETADRYALLSSYFDKALFLYQNRMLNNNYFLGRMSRAVLWSKTEMEAAETLINSRLPPGACSVERLAVPARKYGLKHRIVHET